MSASDKRAAYALFALVVLPYHLAFGFSAVLSLCLLAAIAWKVR